MGGFMAFDLDPGGCWDIADVNLGWETDDRCGFEAVACWEPTTWHDHGSWHELERAAIYFDHDVYYNLGLWEDAWQTAVSAHEWGHNLNLEDHWWIDQCGNPPEHPPLIMGYADISHPPCLTGPSALEVDAVIMNYGLLDSDGDGFTDGVEVYVGTDPFDDCPDGTWDDAWPPDIDRDTDCDIVDVLQFKGHIPTSCGDPGYWQRLDLDPDCDVDTVDVLKLKPYMLTLCTNP